MDKEELKAAIELNREILAQMDPEKLLGMMDEDFNENEITTRAADSEIFYKKHFERTLSLLINQELKNLGEKAETPGQILFYRGSLYFADLIKVWFEKQVQISLGRFEKEEEPEPGEVLPPM